MITRKDVAEKAGVSVTAVSRAITGRGYLAKDKRETILKAAKEMGYHPNPIAQSLKRKSTNQILFYTKNLGNTYTIEMYRGMVNQARKSDYMVMLSGTLNVEKIKSMMIDGIILPNEYDAGYFAKQRSSGFIVPAVSASHGVFVKPPRNIPFVEVDVYAGTRLLLNYLHQKGHRRIALATPYKLNISQPRHVAFINTMKPVYGDRLDDCVLSMGQDEYNTTNQEEDFRWVGEALARQYIQGKSDATVIMCFNDDLATGLLKQFHQMGIRVPQDVSVTGFDGVFIDRYSVPVLTTVDISPFRQGEECMRVLLGLLAGDAPKSYYHTPSDWVQIYEGESVKDLNWN